MAVFGIIFSINLGYAQFNNPQEKGNVASETNIPHFVFESLSILAASLISFNTSFLLRNVNSFLKKSQFFKEKKLIALVAIASTFTILFTLLDDVITPLVYGWSLGAWQAYFYASFSAMLPQTVCTIISVFLFFYPLEKLFNKIFKKV